MKPAPKGMHPEVYKMFVQDAFGVYGFTEKAVEKASHELSERDAIRRLYDQNYLMHGEIWLFSRMPTPAEVRAFQEEGRANAAVDQMMKINKMIALPEYKIGNHPGLYQGEELSYDDDE